MCVASCDRSNYRCWNKCFSVSEMFQVLRKTRKVKHSFKIGLRREKKKKPELCLKKTLPELWWKLKMTWTQVLPRNVNKRFSKRFFYFLKVTLKIYVIYKMSWFVTCSPRPIMERKKVCKHTLFETFERLFEIVTNKSKPVRNGMERKV